MAAPEKSALPDAVRIVVEIFVACDATGLKGRINQVLDRVPDMTAATDVGFYAIKARLLGLKEPRLMSRAEKDAFIIEMKWTEAARIYRDKDIARARAMREDA